MFKNVDGVAKVQQDPDDASGRTWRIDSEDSAALLPHVARTAQENGWTVLEVRAETPSLEQVFRDLMFKYAESKLDEDSAE